MTIDLPVEIAEHVRDILHTDSFKFSSASGGSINEGGRLQTKEDSFFIKWNNRTFYPGMFEAEAKGLIALAQTKSFRVPEVKEVCETSSFQFLLLQFIEQKQKRENYWTTFGEQLAKLHQRTSDLFGLEHQNYIGSLQQFNDRNQSWVEFFIHERLQRQLNLALGNNLIPATVHHNFEKLYLKLSGLLPEEKPSLLHGDLWGGNLITDDNGWPCLIDPAVYYGNREVDLAMTMLFGGFNYSYLEAYHSIFPLQSGYKQRLDIYNLYPLMVHVNLFGKNYLFQVVSILDRFV